MTQDEVCAIIAPTAACAGWRTGIGPERLLNAVANVADELIAGGVRVFLTGLDEGAGLVCAGAVATRRRRDPHIELMAVMPYRDYINDWPPALRDHCAGLTVDFSGIGWVDAVQKPGSFTWRDTLLMDQAGTVLAVYDGSTGNPADFAVRYALRARRRVIRLDPYNGKVERFQV